MQDLEQNPPMARTDLQLDASCVSCGYNLKGLELNSRCPECGTDVADSVHGDRLKYADLNWLRTVHRGIALNLWNLLILVALGLGASILTSLGLPAATEDIVDLIGSGLGCWAAFLITTQEPRISYTEQSLSLRRIVRLASALTIVFSVIAMGFDQLSFAIASVIAVGLGQLCLLVAHLGKFAYLRRFAARIPNEKLGRHTSIVMKGLGIIYFLFVLLASAVGLIALTSGQQGLSTGGVAVASIAVACGGGIGLMLFGIWAIVLLFQYLAAFRQAIDTHPSQIEAAAQT